MKTWLCIFLVGIVAVLHDVAASAQVTVGIRGVRSCSIWAKDRSNSDESWLLGYLSGIASGVGKDFWGAEGVDGLDNESVYLWMDNYCKANPSRNIAEGADRLFSQRSNRQIADGTQPWRETVRHN